MVGHTRSQDIAELYAIDKDSGVPIWLQIRNRIIYLITSGFYAPGDKIPTVRELAVAIGVNYNTVSKVYQGIEHDGYIVSRRGKGTFVCELPADEMASANAGTLALVDDFIRQCLEIGMVPQEIPDIVKERLDAFIEAARNS